MSKKTYVVVGGVAGGAGVAARLRRLDEEANIVMFEKGPYVSFANCGLPYYVGGTIAQRDRLFVTPESTFTDVFNIDVKSSTEVTKIDKEKKVVEAINHLTNEKLVQPYDHLILSPGGIPFIPPIKGIDDKSVFTVRNVPDVDKITESVKTAKKAVVVGGGFIGIEMAENLKEKGLDVSLVEAADQVMITLDREMVAPVHATLRENGINLYLAQALQGVNRVGEKVEVILPDCKIEDVDIVILSIGVKPDSALAKDAGIELGPRGHIIVNENCLTSDKSISAIGDAIEYPSPFFDENNAIALAGPANKMARLCADFIVKGENRAYRGTYGNSIAKVFDLSCGSVGLNEKQLTAKNIEYKVAVTHSVDHASYYPGALPLSVKVIYSGESGVIYGGQAVGYKGVDKRLDVFSALIGMGGTVEDLAGFEQAYAPPFNSAKDVLNMLGFIALNQLDGLDKIVDYKQALEYQKAGALMLDVRSQDEFDLGHLEGSILIPHSQIRENLDKLPKDKDIIIMCGMGLRGHITYRILAQHGYTKIYNLTGGFKTLGAYMKDIKDSEVRTAKETVKEVEEEEMDESMCVILDACGLQCPGPIVQLKKQMDKLEVGQVLNIKATDPGFQKDVHAWADMTGNALLKIEKHEGIINAFIKKGEKKVSGGDSVVRNGASLIVFSNDFDKALASFVLANGAAASGKDVTMFFTFWGLSVLKKKPNTKVKKDFMGKMFSMMLPSDMDHLKLSSMNFAGMGPKMMKSRMKKKQVDQLRVMYAQAKASGVRMIACQMSMDIMGVSEKELLDGVEVGGVATYMAEASKCDVNLFI